MEQVWTLVRFDSPTSNEGTNISWHETLEEAELAKIPRDLEVGPHYEIISRPRFTAIEAVGRR